MEVNGKRGRVKAHDGQGALGDVVPLVEAQVVVRGEAEGHVVDGLLDTRAETANLAKAVGERAGCLRLREVRVEELRSRLLVQVVEQAAEAASLSYLGDHPSADR